MDAFYLPIKKDHRFWNFWTLYRLWNLQQFYRYSNFRGVWMACHFLGGGNFSFILKRYLWLILAAITKLYVKTWLVCFVYLIAIIYWFHFETCRFDCQTAPEGFKPPFFLFSFLRLYNRRLLLGYCKDQMGEDHNFFSFKLIYVQFFSSLACKIEVLLFLEPQIH